MKKIVWKDEVDFGCILAQHVAGVRGKYEDGKVKQTQLLVTLPLIKTIWIKGDFVEDVMLFLDKDGDNEILNLEQPPSEKQPPPKEKNTYSLSREYWDYNNLTRRQRMARGSRR